MAFLRISTNPRVFELPLTAGESVGIASSWLARPNVVIVEPGPRRFEIVSKLLVDEQSMGPLITDAALAALKMEHGATLHTTDRDFSRFKSLDWVNPIESASV